MEGAVEGFERELERDRVEAFERGWGKDEEVGERREGRGLAIDEIERVISVVHRTGREEGGK